MPKHFRLFSFVILAAFLCLSCEKTDLQPDTQDTYLRSAAKPPLPVFPDDPKDFVRELTNPYLSFTPGKIFHYESVTDEGLETIIVEVTSQNKKILGVSTTVVHDQVFLDGNLIEDTFDWYAQDKDGNVWYFGEDSKEILNGEVISTEGSWEAGVDGAMPGIIMLAQPVKGIKYQQEFAEGIAEDMAQIVSLSSTATISLDVFEDCLETMEWTPLEPGHREHKFYKPGIGLVLEEGPGGQQVQLVLIEG